MIIAIIGCGQQAPKHLAGLRSVMEDEDEIVLADLIPAKAALLAEKEGLKAADSVAAVMADPKVDAVDICTPTPSHHPLVLEAIATGKSVFCEKPLAQSAGDAQTLASALRDTGLVGMVGFLYRYSPVFQAGHAIMPGTGRLSPILGEMSSALFRLGGRGSTALWKHRAGQGGGAINEMLVHMIDLAMWFLGPVKSARLHSARLHRKHRIIAGEHVSADAEDFVLAELEMESGVVATLQADLLTASFTQMVEVQGDNGSFFGSIDARVPSQIFCSEPRGGFSRGATALSFPPSNLFQEQLRLFLEHLRHGHLAESCTFEESVAVLRVVDDLKAQAGSAKLPA